MIKRRKIRLRSYIRQIKKNQEQIKDLAKVMTKLAIAKHAIADTIKDHTTAINILTAYFDNLKNLLIDGGLLVEVPVKESDLEPDLLEEDSDIKYTSFSREVKKDSN